MRSARLVVLASAVGMLGWGTVLPYQYAYAASTRGWGGLVAALASSLFSVGALAAAPVGGRLADRWSPALVAISTKVVAAVAAASLTTADRPGTFLAGMAVFGFALAAGTPAQSVLLLNRVRSDDRRSVFAWLATGQALGMGVGAFAAGYVVDLRQADGMDVAFGAAASGFALSGLLVALAVRGVNDITSPPVLVPTAPGETGRALRLVAANPALRWTAVLTAALALAFYAQFDSGLPAYALIVLDVSERTVGTAAAVNCFVLLVLQMGVVKWTASRSAPRLLMAVGAIWLLCWVILAFAARTPELAPTVLVVTFGLFAAGETMYGPVLNPLVAQLAPDGYVGTTLGLFSGLQTGVSALGPLIAGVALGAGLADGFVAVHVLFSAVAVFAAWRLLRTVTEHFVAADNDDERQSERPAERSF
ncbi:MFS transporter [uncultured Friedmanniella sp.]|uniref:MFS transporter n=1 Tax=uncultured Friedmanniella sp. TaxID=335381 RepID=UPI0035CC8E8C